jgi:hypothetical protein
VDTVQVDWESLGERCAGLRGFRKFKIDRHLRLKAETPKQLMQDGFGENQRDPMW